LTGRSVSADSPAAASSKYSALNLPVKTTLSLHVIAEAQKKGGICAFIDAEHALDPEYAKRLGVDINSLLVSQPDTGEQALEIVESLVRSGKIDVIVIDSVAALTPKDEIEGRHGPGTCR
jgi:recombination protein RecA